jgi:hypothetical protein
MEDREENNPTFPLLSEEGLVRLPGSELTMDLIVLEMVAL